MFVDASAIVAIIANEPDAEDLMMRLQNGPPLTSSMAFYEAVLGLARKRSLPLDVARKLVDKLIAQASIHIVVIGPAELDAALEAFDRFGKGRHPARLNMGDCFAYACARTHGVPLLFKGDDFPQTDIEPA